MKNTEGSRSMRHRTKQEKRMGYAEAEYRKLKELVEFLGRVIEGKDKDLHEAEMALKGNTGKPEILGDVERNLRNARVKILSELTGIINNSR